MTELTKALSILDFVWTNPSWLYAIVQLGVLAVFLISTYRAWQHSGERLLELLSAVVFGLLLEEGDIIIFQTYRYNPHWFAFDLVPPAIALCWAIIIASAMNISDSLGIDERIAPIADAVWAIILDLALDAVAIRLGFWTWTIPTDKGWFGVPYSNFFAWLLVAAAFSYFTRIVRRAATRNARAKFWQLAVPIPAYAVLIAGVASYIFIQKIYFREVGSDWILFTIAMATFGFITLRAVMSSKRMPREAPDVYLVAIRYVMHLYFLWALFSTRIFIDLPALLFTSLTMLALETVLVIVVARSHPAPPPILAWAKVILHRRSRE